VFLLYRVYYFAASCVSRYNNNNDNNIAWT